MNNPELKRLLIVNEKLRKHDMKILFDGKSYRLLTIGIPGYSSSSLWDHQFRDIQSALDFITTLTQDHKVTNY